jgi:hypothetical protein
MSFVAATRGAASEPRGRLEDYRDDGPLARFLGGALENVPVSAAALTLLAALPLAAMLLSGGARGSAAALGATTAWAILAGGVASGRPHSGRFAWLVSPVLRALEYGSLLGFAVLAGPSAVPLSFALVAVLTFHHYDTVYRLRHQGVAPPAWLSLAGGGWDGRILVGYLLLVTGTLRPGFIVLAVVLGVTYLVESIVSWARFSQPQRPSPYADEEDEDE